MTIEEQLLELQDRVSNMQKAMFNELTEIWAFLEPIQREREAKIRSNESFRREL